MNKSNYLHILFVIQDITAGAGKFDFDKALDGTYDFNMNDVSILYELVHTIEKIAASREMLKSTKQGDALLKEFKYEFNSKIYQVSRFYDNDEHTYITGSTFTDCMGYVKEQELMDQMEEKCKILMHRLNKIYEERAKTRPAG